MANPPKTAFDFTPPRESLRAFVESAWISNTTEPHILHIMPTTRPVLMTCDTPDGFGLVLVGPLTSAQHVQLQQGNRKVGVWLKPGTRCLFQPLAMDALRDAVVVGADMQPTALFQQFNAAIQHMENPVDALDKLQDLLETLVAQGLLARDTHVDTFIRKVEQDSTQSVLDGLMHGLPISYRQFVRRFKQYTGLTPKAFASIQRLGTAVSSVITPEPASLARIATEHGYADHAHFTRELTMRTRIAPSALIDKQVVM